VAGERWTWPGGPERAHAARAQVRLLTQLGEHDLAAREAREALQATNDRRLQEARRPVGAATGCRAREQALERSWISWEPSARAADACAACSAADSMPSADMRNSLPGRARVPGQRVLCWHGCFRRRVPRLWL
jgi:hypothetical protein